MRRAQSDSYSSLFTKSENVNLDKTLDRKSALVHVLTYRKKQSNVRKKSKVKENKKERKRK